MIRMRIAITTIVLVPMAWMASASALFCWLAGRWELYRFPFIQWAQAAPWWRFNWHMTVWVIASAAAPTIVTLIVGYGVWQHLSTHRRQPSLYGRTGWANPDEITRGGLKLDRDTF